MPLFVYIQGPRSFETLMLRPPRSAFYPRAIYAAFFIMINILWGFSSVASLVVMPLLSYLLRVHDAMIGILATLSKISSLVVMSMANTGTGKQKVNMSKKGKEGVGTAVWRWVFRVKASNFLCFILILQGRGLQGHYNKAAEVLPSVGKILKHVTNFKGLPRRPLLYLYEVYKIIGKCFEAPPSARQLINKTDDIYLCCTVQYGWKLAAYTDLKCTQSCLVICCS